MTAARPNAVPTLSEPTATEIEAVLAEYGAGALIRHWPASGGIENSNFFILTEHQGTQREYVLTILEQPANAGERLVPLLDVCVDAGLPVPRALRTRAGSAFGVLDEKPTLLCPRLAGNHVYNPTEGQVEALGRFLARFHLATANTEMVLPPYPRTRAWLATNAADCRAALPFGARALMDRARAIVESELGRRDVGALPQGPIHGDLFRDNVLFNEWGLSGVLDFHHAARGFLIYDLAVAANDWCTESNGALDPERTLALLRAYHAIRPLRHEELWHFPVFALYGALAFWISRLVVALAKERGEAVRANNPTEFERILSHRVARSFYVDERRLG